MCRGTSSDCPHTGDQAHAVQQKLDICVQMKNKLLAGPANGNVVHVHEVDPGNSKIMTGNLRCNLAASIEPPTLPKVQPRDQCKDLPNPLSSSRRPMT